MANMLMRMHGSNKNLKKVQLKTAKNNIFLHYIKNRNPNLILVNAIDFAIDIQVRCVNCVS